MITPDERQSDPKTQLDDLLERVQSYFARCAGPLSAVLAEGWWKDTPEYYWRELPEEFKAEAEQLTACLLSLAKPFARLCKASLLATDADLGDILLNVRVMRAALHLRDYHYSEPEEIHDEGVILGFRPASQEERSPLKPVEALGRFTKSTAQLNRILQVCDTDSADGGTARHKQQEANKYRPNTAFILMWMDRGESTLEDVRDAVQQVFNEFDIRAMRADDIEHDGVITQRVLEEIRTSEFLFGDLTGARPNVYYEVGYAHALGKRVILFRKRDTQLHFDLAGYNCPEYENLRDLKEKLRKRLVSVTNKEPKS
jgi:hypothetical protein